MWEIAQKREEVLLLGYLIIGTVCLSGLVRWKKNCFYVVAPLVVLVSILIFDRTMEALSADGDFYRGFPTSRYVVLGFVAVLIPAVACGLAFLLPKKEANQPAQHNASTGPASSSESPIRRG